MLLRKYFHVFPWLQRTICVSNDDIEVAGGTAFQQIRPGAGFKAGDFVKEKLGGLP